MGRKPCIALLLCFCSCSLDTTPDIEPASQPDASMSHLSARKWQQASLRFDAPLQPRTVSSLKRAARDDADAGHGPPHDDKPESRDAGRTASDRPAQASPRDAGAVDAGAMQKSKTTGDATSDVKDASADSSHAKNPSSASDPAASQEHDAGDRHSTRSSEDDKASQERRGNGEERHARREHSDGNDEEERDWGHDRGSDDDDENREHGSDEEHGR